MSLRVGTRLGPYEIVSPLGVGGMGEVYRARDTQLKRDVAIKVLADSFSQDPDRLARFQREAELLASLNDPNIAAIYGLEKADGITGIVLELVDGQTLADRIARGPVPLDEALPIAKQIAEALEAAHETGIVHRDLKPANIKVRPDGTVKVLDFGLAKLAETGRPGGSGGPGRARGVDASASPTITTPAMTQMGMILGTAAYMSPEQAKGRPADKRSDIWAFGCVLYEMLAGKRAFEGEDVSDTLANVLKTEPDWMALPLETPPAIHRLLRRCLAKDRARRLPDAAVARLEIDDAPLETAASVAVPPKSARRAERGAWAVGVIVAAVVTALVGSMLRTQAAPPEMRFEIATTPATTSSSSFAIAPGGQLFVYMATLGNRTQLWVRALDSLTARALSGTDGAQFPFWSPDERSIGFFAGGKLKRIDLDGGAVQTLADAISPGGGTWSRNGTIVYSPNTSTPLLAVSQNGGEPKPVAGLIRPGGHRAPHFLPDGRRFLYTAEGFKPGAIGVFVGDLEGASSQRVIEASYAGYSSGHLLFVRQGNLFGQPFDPTTLTLTGSASVIAERVPITPQGFAASESRTIIYRTAAGDSAAGPRQFVWFDRGGARVRAVGESMAASNPSPAPDERHVVFQRTVDRNSDIWLADTERGLVTRLTSDPGLDALPLGSPDGRRVLFGSLRTGSLGLYTRSIDGSGKDEAIDIPPTQSGLPADWSHDGRFILYRRFNASATGSASQSGLPTGGKTDLWVLPLDGKGEPFPVVKTDFDTRDGQFSPDDKWIAYESDESGRQEIYVQRFPGPGGKERISTEGGTQVRWRSDGRELFYIAPGGRLMAVPIRADSRGDRLEPGTPSPLFATSIGGPPVAFRRQEYVVSADGQRFLINTLVQDTDSALLTVILNWRAGLAAHETR